jgi:hypothetical protein
VRKLAAAAALIALLATVPSPAPARATDAVAQAQAHFKRGVELYEEGDYAGSLVEFRRAYDLVPNSKVLFNLGRVASAQHDHALALGYYRKYLADSGAQLPAGRRREVEEEIQRLTRRVGHLRILVGAPGAQVTVDDVTVGVAPLSEPILVNAGRRRVAAALPNLPPVARVAEVAGEELITVTLDLRPVAPAARPLALPAPAPAPPRALRLEQRRAPAARPSRTWPVVCWTATGLLAAGAAVAGGIAITSSRDLRELRDQYPASLGDLERTRDRTRTAALVTDGLLAGAAAMAALSLYLTFSAPGGETRVSIGPGSLGLSGRF